ncbi:MAG: hypothetical protein IJ153_04575 [Clostridia bacterium]|nr:hypothetical protein [Clostridia bacterium]
MLDRLLALAEKGLFFLCLFALCGLPLRALAARGGRGSTAPAPTLFSSLQEEGVPVSEVPASEARVFYEIFTGSFSDSDGDGTGDLRGVLGRLDYLNDGDPHSETSLGVQGLWLTPIFASPSYHKYDITDYDSIDPAFGTLEDLQALIDACHARDMLLILDLPLNHTSDQHPWFQQFLSARREGRTEDPFYDFYACAGEEREASRTWYPLAETEEYYEGNFSPNMPELNFDNPAVRQAALDIGKRYLSMGVDGFRFDAAKYIYYGENARSADFWQWYADELRAVKPDVWMVAEVWDADTITDQYYPALDCFNFTLSGAGGFLADTAAGGNVNRYTVYVESYLNTIHFSRPDSMIIPFLSNHDTDRAAGFLPDSNGRARMAANLYLLGPGAPFIYYGEEIGLKGSRGGANTDANRRLAMRWGDGDPVSDPPGAKYSSQTSNTVSDQLAQRDSLFHYYRQVIALRKQHPEIARGSYQALAFEDTPLGGFLSTWEGSTVAVLHNSTTAPITLELRFASIPVELLDFQTISGYIGQGVPKLENNTLTIPPQTSVILR